MPGPAFLDAQLFRSLRRHRNYRLYFGGQLGSQVGTWLQNAAQAWLILDLSHNSATAVGILSFCLYTPYAILGLIGAAMADRWDRQKVMVITQSGMAVCATALAVVAYLRVDSVLVVYCIAMVRGSIMAFNNPARQALMVQLVGRSELPNAIALNSSLNNATRVIGPAVAGVLIATVGVGMCFALNAISFVPIIWALASMRPAEFFATGHRSTGPILRSIREGIAYARRNKTVRIVLIMLFLTSTVAINFDIVLPVLARLTMHGGAQTYGFITAIFGLGAFTGAVTAASRKQVSRTLLIAASAGFGCAQLFVATQQSLLGVGIALYLTGICYTLYTANSNALVQLAVPPQMQGRIAGLYNYVFLAAGPLGSLLAGWLADRGGAPLALVAGGATAITMALFGFVLRPWPMPTGTVRARKRTKTTFIAGA